MNTWKTRKTWIGGAVLLAALAVPLAALASHGRVGLWKITATMHMAGFQMPHLSREEMAQMKAMGVHIPTSHTFAVEHCMSAAEVNANAPPAYERPQSGCTTTNVKVMGQTMTADMVCKGEMKGRGHVRVTYDSPEHYAGKASFKGTMEGRPIDATNTFEGKWVSADCGNIHH